MKHHCAQYQSDTGGCYDPVPQQVHVSFVFFQTDRVLKQLWCEYGLYLFSARIETRSIP